MVRRRSGKMLPVRSSMQHVSDIKGRAASLVRRGACTTILFHKQAGRKSRILVVGSVKIHIQGYNVCVIISHSSVKCDTPEPYLNHFSIICSYNRQSAVWRVWRRGNTHIRVGDQRIRFCLWKTRVKNVEKISVLHSSIEMTNWFF